MRNWTLYRLLNPAASAANSAAILSYRLYLSFNPRPSLARRDWKKLRCECGGFWDRRLRSGAFWRFMFCNKEASDARTIFLAGIELDGGAHCAARNRHRFRAPP